MRTASSPTSENYYGIPLLKKPKWGWEIALYFFFEGVSSAAYLLASLARLFGRRKMNAVVHTGHRIAFFSLLPCPPLLVKDLGRPERFIYMLRVFKPGSPMNAGAWALLGFSLPAGVLGMRLLPATFVEPLGIPFALFMLSYPGVLLSNTATPVWSRTRLLGALFAVSSINTGIAAISIALARRGGEEHALGKLERLQRIGALAEAGLLAGYLMRSGRAAKPLIRGQYAPHLWAGAVGVGLALPIVLSGVKKRAACTLAGGFLLKWAVTHAGPDSSEDVEATQAGTTAAISS